MLDFKLFVYFGIVTMRKRVHPIRIYFWARCVTLTKSTSLMMLLRVRQQQNVAHFC